MKPVPISQAKAQLSKLIAKALAGEEVIIARGKTPVVKLVAIPAEKPRRRFGAWKHRGKFNDSFFDPLPKGWTGED